MASILETLQSQLSPEVMGRLSQQLGADPQRTQGAVDTALPVLLAALARNTATPEGAAALSGALSRDHNGAILDGLPQAVAAPSRTDGEGILRHVLGGREAEVESALSRQTGVDAGVLLQTLAPVVLGVLGRMQQQQRLDPGDLAGALQGEQRQMQQSQGGLMSAVTSLLDGNRDGSVVDDLAGFASRFLDQGRQGGRGA